MDHHASFMIINYASVIIRNHCESSMIMHHHASWIMIHHRSSCIMHDHSSPATKGSPFMAWGVGGKNLTARIVPDTLGGKMGAKVVPVRAVNAPTISKCTARRDEANRDDRRSPNPLFWVETAGFQVDIFGRFFVDFLGCP